MRAALEHGKRPEVSVSVALVSDAELAAIHGRFLGDPSPTDVISFELGDEDGPGAEICVSVERAAAVARRRGVSPASELRLYLIHGALHLCGFDDHAPRDRARMRRAEAFVLRAHARTREPRPDGKTGKTSTVAGASASRTNARDVSAAKRGVSRSRGRAR